MQRGSHAQGGMCSLQSCQSSTGGELELVGLVAIFSYCFSHSGLFCFVLVSFFAVLVFVQLGVTCMQLKAPRGEF